MTSSLPSPRIFLCYRRDDSQDVVGRIHDHLALAFGAGAVFKDTDEEANPLGVDYRSELARAVEASGAVLVIIGPEWLRIADEQGRPRLFAPDDMVRDEIAVALGSNKLIIPVLVSGAAMPRPDQLPGAIRALATRNAVAVRRDPDFRGDMSRIIERLRRHIGPSRSAPDVPRPLRVLQVQPAAASDPRPAGGATLPVPAVPVIPHAGAPVATRRRWPWAVGGAVLAVFAGVAGYALSGSTEEGDESTIPSMPRSASPAGECPADMVRVDGGRVRLAPALDLAEWEGDVSDLCVERHEVRVRDYWSCVHAGACPEPEVTCVWDGIGEDDARWCASRCNGAALPADDRHDRRGDHPINCVDLASASRYCAWRGRRLPTEPEWQLAASGATGRAYPWGSEPLSHARANACGTECVPELQEQRGAPVEPMFAGDDGFPRTAPVGMYPAGASPEGLVDLVGNVAEWVTPATSANQLDFARGGGWDEVRADVLTARFRYGVSRGARASAVGFRCVAAVASAGD